MLWLRPECVVVLVWSLTGVLSWEVMAHTSLARGISVAVENDGWLRRVMHIIVYSSSDSTSKSICRCSSACLLVYNWCLGQLCLNL